MGVPYMGGGRFSAGWWKADNAGTPAVVEGPGEVERPHVETVSEKDSRLRDERTAANLAERQASLAPRRYRP